PVDFSKNTQNLKASFYPPHPTTSTLESTASLALAIIPSNDPINTIRRRLGNFYNCLHFTTPSVLKKRIEEKIIT
ncbi:hypothetical protein, partial [Enterobacter cloacae complex sp. 2DZ2F20B]|uniref:hypothetical protein n=1 Tax=Enterobacter cloacae complex sp. 2DZ2F20B TaxID=2511993 RepID=UPI001CA583D7